VQKVDLKVEWADTAHSHTLILAGTMLIGSEFL